MTVDGLADFSLLYRPAFPVLRWPSPAAHACTSLSRVETPGNPISVAFGYPPSFALEFYRLSLHIYWFFVRNNGLYKILLFLSDYGFM